MFNHGDGLNAELICDALAYPNHIDKTVYLLSAAGPSVSIKALRAALISGKPTFDFATERGSGRRVPGLYKDGAGYTCSKPTKLGYSTWHLIAVSRRRGFLPAGDDESLWQHLATHYTTPMLRHWMPWIRQQLKAGGGIGSNDGPLLVEPTRFGCQSVQLALTEDDLDNIVRRGVLQGALSIDEPPCTTCELRKAV